MKNELIGQRISELVERLNQYRHEYYNLAKPSVSDAVYDKLFDELKGLEETTGIILANSPTQTVGYAPVSKLAKVRHPIPLLSMDKTKQTSNLLTLAEKADTLLMMKLDGLTIKLCYENGELKEASTRGDGEIGEDITHNIPAFLNVPLKIPHKKRLVITGEGLIRNDDFETLKKNGGFEDVGNSRNLASGSIRLLDPSECKNRKIRFYAFNIIESMEAFRSTADHRSMLLRTLTVLGFDVCPFVFLGRNPKLSEIEKNIQELRKKADKENLPIDGIVLRYDSISYSRTLGRTGHHYKDGIAFKFEDDAYETIFRSIEWETSRSGVISPVAIFDPVEIDGCKVSRASLHNLSFIKELALHAGCRILVSKRNMIIPHIEENLDRGFDKGLIPQKCPCCGSPTRVFSRAGSGRMIETLHCDNPDCRNQEIRKFVHFASKKAMNIEGISKATIEKLVERGYLKTFADFYHLARYRREITEMPGFGNKAYWNIFQAVEKSRNTTFVRYLVAMDIPMVGRTASRALDNYFGGGLKKFADAAISGFDFTVLPDFGDTLNNNIREWFGNADNLKLWNSLQKELKFERKDVNMKNTNEKNNPFMGCTIVATGKLENFTRDGINSKIASLGAIAGSSVTRKTDYLICGDKPGSKLTKAKELGVPVLTERQFLDMISA